MSTSETTPGTSTSEPATTTEPDTGSTSFGSESGATGTESSSGSDSGSGSSSTGFETSCDPPAVDGSAIGQNCMGAECPEGYDCIDHQGIVLMQSCGIFCTDDCECPDGFSCTEFTDKAGTHYECAP